jgi:phosphoadenosine phosphosulfate reductase
MSDAAHVPALRAKLGALGAPELLKDASLIFGNRIALATSLGAEDQVLTDMLAHVAPGVPIFTLDTGRLPQETYDLIDATRKRYGIEIEVLFPDREAVEAMVNQKGVNLFYHSVENRKACCHVRKVIPLRRKLAGLDAWVTGLRREQAVTRQDVQTVEWDQGNGLVKINPLANWSADQVWEYIRRHNVPYNALHDKGYPSIGCAPCTRAVAPGDEVRSGRWWWEEPQHKECGLHVVDGNLVRKGNKP